MNNLAEQHSQAIAQAAKPLMIYLKQNFNPHTIVTIKGDAIEVAQGILGIHCKFTEEPLIIVPDILPSNDLRS